MKRILILGSGGAGKSTLAVQIGQRTGLPVVHLDALYWRAGWVESPKDQWQQAVEQVIQGDRWVIDGNYSGTLDRRLAAADAVIFLDMPRLLCLFRIVKRRLMYRGRTRPDMSDGCPERLDWEFVKWVWNYPRNSRPKIMKRIDAAGQSKRVKVLRSSRQVRQFLGTINHANKATDGSA